MFAKIRAHFTVDTLLPLFAAVVALSWVWSTISVMQRNFVFQQQVDQLRQEIELLEIQNKTIQYQIAYYKTPEYAELSAREDLNKAAPGERVLILPPSQYEHEDPSGGGSQAGATIPESNFEQWVYFLFGQHSSKK